MDSSYLELAGSALGGTTLGAIAIRVLISKILKDLKESVVRITALETKLSNLEIKFENTTFRLEEMSKTYQLFRELDRKVIAIETKLNGRYHKN